MTSRLFVDPTLQRTQEQILERLEALDAQSEDTFGFRAQVLREALDYEHVKHFVDESVTEQLYESVRRQDGFTDAKARAYLEFAIGKIIEHRGISASRSVDKLREYAWLLGRDSVVGAMDEACYAQYGAPKVRAFAEGMEWRWPDDPALTRMSTGDKCNADCTSGCGV